MIVKRKGVFHGLILAGLLALFGNTLAHAQVIQLGTVLNGAAPSSNPPWLTATFGTIFPGTVSLTLELHLTTASEFIGEIGLNLRPGISPASLVFSQNSGPSYTTVNLPSAENSVNLPGGGSQGAGFDMLINWPGGGSSQVRFDAQDVVSLTITGPSTLSAEDFLFYNSVGGKDGPAIIGAHVQGIPLSGGGTTSAAIMQTIPEPASGALLLGGLLAVLLARRRAA